MRCFLLALMFVVAMVRFADAQSSGRKDVLVIHSYHTEHTWTSRLKVGIDDVLEGNDNLNLIHEHMDAKRHPDAPHADDFWDYLLRKHGENSPELILISDDAALQMFQQHRGEAFSGVPVVFMGVNKVSEQLIDDPGYTGVFENRNIASTIFDIRQMTGSDALLVISSAKAAGAANLAKARAVEGEPRAPAEMHFIEEITKQNAAELLSDYPETMPILLLGQVVDTENGNALMGWRSGTEFLSNLRDNPLFSIGQISVEFGAVGADNLEAFNHGQQAAELALSVLGGIPVSQVPSIVKAESIWYIDWQKMKAHGYALEDLPPNAIVLNPDEFWTEERQRIAWILLAIGGVLFLLTGVFAVMNLKARRQAEHAAAITQELSSRLTAVMDAARNGVMAFNHTGEVAFANPSALAILGVPKLVAPCVWPMEVRFVDVDDREPLAPEACPQNRIIAGDILDGEMAWILGPDGKTLVHLLLSSSSIDQGMSSEIASVLVLDDVSEQVLIREVAERSERMSAIGHLTGGVAHDFNNLLAVIMGNLELVLEEEADEYKSSLLQSAINATLRGADLTRSMLAFARRSRLTPERLNLNTLVEDARTWVGRTLPETISISTRLPDDLWDVSIDPSATESMLLNLIVNARDAMDGVGHLTVETSNLVVEEVLTDAVLEDIVPGRYVLLTISDTGHGIPPEALKDIFTPFYTTKSPGTGTGLGLSMVMGFIKQSGGGVRVYSEINSGTTFKLFFPTTSGNDLPRGGVLRETPEQDLRGNGNRILLAEDEDAVASVLVAILERANYEVTRASTGDEALRIYESDGGFDLLLTDIVMPGELQGPDLAREISKRDQSLPIVFMTGYAKEASVHRKDLHSHSVRLMKPVQRRDLLETLAQARSAATSR